MKKNRCVIYARVSSKEQEKSGFSIPSQLKLLRKYVIDNDQTILDEFIDVETAKKTGRENFTSMLEFIQEKNCDLILVEKTDRLYRNIRDWVALDDIGVDIHFVKENFILSRDSHSSQKFLHGIKVLMAKNYIDNLKEEIRKSKFTRYHKGGTVLLSLSVISMSGIRTKRKSSFRTMMLQSSKKCSIFWLKEFMPRTRFVR